MQAVVATLFATLAVAFWVFQVAQHQKFDEMAENNHRRRLPLPAPRGVLFDRNGKVLVENQNTVNIALDREQSGNIDDTLRLVAAHRRRRSADTRDRQSPPSRAELSADRAGRERDQGAGRRGQGATPRTARDHRAGSAGATVSPERDRRASLRLRQRGERSRPDQARVCRRRIRVDGGEGGRRTVVQQAADGQGRRPARLRQQPRPRDGDGEPQAGPSKAGASS